METPNKNLNSAEPKETKVVAVEAKPIEISKTNETGKTNNVRIDNIGSLTLNFFADPLKKRFEKHYKNNLIHLGIDLVLVLIVLILLGSVLNVWLFSRSKLLNLIDFQVSSNPTNLVNGQETEFIISYDNTTKNTLTDVTLVFKKPESLHNPTYSLNDFDLKTNTLKIGDLAPKAHGQFTVKGFLLGNYTEQQKFLAIMNYKNKYGQDMQEFFEKDFQLSASALKTEISLPKRIIATSPFSTKITLDNSSNLDFAKIKIKMDWPKGYNFNQAENTKTLNDQTWQLEPLNSKQSLEYNFIGQSYVDKPQDIEIGANVYIDYNGQEYLITRVKNTAFVDFSKVTLNFNDLEKNHSINPGGESTYSITYKNGEGYAVNNVEIGLMINGEYAAVSQVKVDQNDFKKLTLLEPGQEGSLALSAKAKSSIDFSEPKENGYNLTVKIFATFDDPLEKSRLTVESSPITTLVNSKLSLNTMAIFYTSSGDQIGVGSVPPVVDEYTSYWTVIKVVNANNPIKDIKITATIPAGVDFSEVYNVTVGNQLVFNEASRQITWQLDNVSAFAGIFSPGPEARIQLAITPAQSQVGTSPILLSNITATATDAKTGAFITASGKNITTAISSDPLLNKVID